MRAAERASLSGDTTLRVYPTGLKADDVARAEARAGGCLLGHRITTFPQLLDALARDLGVGVRVLEPHLAAVVLARALERPDTPAALRAPRPGLLRELLSLLEELEAACLDPDDVRALAQELDGPAAERMDDVARAYRAYATELAALGAVDRRGRERAVWEALLEAERTGRGPAVLAGVRRIVFAELYDFSVLQFLLAASLIRLVGDAELVAFAHPENVDATRFAERTWNRFVADASISDQVLPSFVVRGGRAGALAAALRGVFATERPPAVPADGTIRLVAAPGRYAEVEAAVRDIRRRLERGERAERIAIVVRDLAVYGELIEDVCRRYRVSVWFRRGRPLLASGVVGACLDVLRCVTDGFPRARLAAVLESDYFGRVSAGLGRVLSRVGYVSERAQPLARCVAHEIDRLARRAASGDTAARARAAGEQASLAARGRRVEEIVATLRRLAGRRTVAAHVHALRAVLRALRFRPVPRDDLAPAAARRDALAYARLDEILDALAGLTRAMRLPALDLDGFTRMLLAALESLEVEDRRERSGVVRALGVLEARGLDFDAVYLLGLDDGTFPAARAESPLFPDALRRLVNPLAAARLRRTLGAHVAGLPLGGLLRTARESSLEEPFLFFLALSMAEREVVLSYPATDERGSPTVRSPFVDEVDACLGGTLLAERVDPGRLVPALAEACEPGELVGRAALERWTGPGPDRLTPALRAMPAVGPARLAAIDRRARIEERRSRFFLTRLDHGRDALVDAYVGRLGPAAPAVAARLDGQRWSPTRLNALATCGFKFFAETVLGLRDDPAPGLDLDPRERGDLFHAVIAELFRRHPRLPDDLAAARALARDLVADARDAFAAAIGAKDPAFLAIEWDQLLRTLDAVVIAEHRAQQELAAAGLDVEHLVETELAADVGGLVLFGRPDRLELHRRDGELVAVRALDYKVSANRARFKKQLESDGSAPSVQIPVYLLVALHRLGPAAERARLSGAYVLAREAPPRQLLERELSRAELLGPNGEGGGTVVARLAALVEAARAGRFDVDPRPCDAYCAFRGVCRYQEPPAEEEAAEDG